MLNVITFKKAVTGRSTAIPALENLFCIFKSTRNIKIAGLVIMKKGFLGAVFYFYESVFSFRAFRSL